MSLTWQKNDPTRHFIFEVNVKYPSELLERADVYLMAAELMTIKQETTGEKQLKHRANYFTASCPYSLKLICLVFLNKRYVIVLGHMVRFYFDR